MVKMVVTVAMIKKTIIIISTSLNTSEAHLHSEAFVRSLSSLEVGN